VSTRTSCLPGLWFPISYTEYPPSLLGWLEQDPSAHLGVVRKCLHYCRKHSLNRSLYYTIGSGSARSKDRSSRALRETTRASSVGISWNPLMEHSRARSETFAPVQEEIETEYHGTQVRNAHDLCPRTPTMSLRSSIGTIQQTQRSSMSAWFNKCLSIYRICGAATCLGIVYVCSLPLATYYKLSF
jgi:hypothetical protein